jgi:hypothetical protein
MFEDGYGEPGAEGEERFAREEEPEYSLPWQSRERYASWLDAVVETVKVVLFDPSRAFRRIQEPGSFGSSFVYLVLVGSVGVVAWQMVAAFLQMVGLLSRRALGGNPAELLLPGVGLVGLFVVNVAIALGALVVGALINAGVVHVFLLIVGGARRTFEATFCVVAYASATTSLLQIVPVCGTLAALVWQLVILIIGLAAAHQTTTGKSAVAVLMPMLLCCGAVFALFAVVIGFGMLAGAQ